MSQSTGMQVPQFSVIDSLNNAPISFFTCAPHSARGWDFSRTPTTCSSLGLHSFLLNRSGS